MSISTKRRKGLDFDCLLVLKIVTNYRTVRNTGNTGLLCSPDNNLDQQIFTATEVDPCSYILAYGEFELPSDFVYSNVTASPDSDPASFVSYIPSSTLNSLR